MPELDDKPERLEDWMWNDGTVRLTHGEKVLIARPTKGPRFKWDILVAIVEFTNYDDVWFTSGDCSWHSVDVPWFIRLLTLEARS